MSSGKYWALADQAVQSATNFLTMVMAARAMGAAQFAMFSLAYLATLFVLSFHRTWVTQPMNVLGSMNPETLRGRATALLRGHLGLVPLGIAMIAGIAPFGFASVAVTLATAGYLALYLVQEFFRRYAYSSQRVHRAAISSLAMGTVQCGVVVALSIAGEQDPALWLVGLGLPQMVGIVVAGWGEFLIRRGTGGATPSAVLSEHWRHSRWVVASQVVFWLSSQAYPFLLAGTDTVAVASFNAGMSVLNAGNVLRLTLANYLPAHMGRVHREGGDGGVATFARRTITRVLVGSLVVWPMLFFLAGPTLEMLYEGKFAGAEAVLTWGALGLFASMISVVLNAVALVVRQTRGIFVSNAIGAVFTCTAGVFLISQCGITGAIIGTVVGYAIPAAYQLIQLRTVIFTGKK